MGPGSTDTPPSYYPGDVLVVTWTSTVAPATPLTIELWKDITLWSDDKLIVLTTEALAGAESFSWLIPDDKSLLSVDDLYFVIRVTSQPRVETTQQMSLSIEERSQLFWVVEPSAAVVWIPLRTVTVAWGYSSLPSDATVSAWLHRNRIGPDVALGQIFSGVPISAGFYEFVLSSSLADNNGYYVVLKVSPSSSFVSI